MIRIKEAKFVAPLKLGLPFDSNCFNDGLADRVSGLKRLLDKSNNVYLLQCLIPDHFAKTSLIAFKHVFKVPVHVSCARVYT